jgi:sulfur carrier protein
MISVTINGKKHELDRPMTVQAYLESKGLAGRRLAVAVNGTVLRNEELATTTVGDGDRMEIVRPVGGGCSETCRDAL